MILRTILVEDPDHRMKRKIIAAVLATGAAALITALLVYIHAVYSGSTGGLHTAVIKVGGSTVRTIDLSTATDEEFTVESGGGYNLICVKNGEIFVKEASCPDKICVEHGSLRSEYLPIICLPNRLEIDLV